MDYIDRVLKEEGLYSDVVGDRGGKTMRGITWRLYVQYCKRRRIALSEPWFRSMSVEDAREIYKVMFIQPLNISVLYNDRVKEAMFGAAIHHGGGRAVRFAQRTAGKLKVDGIIGPKTIDGINKAEPIAFVNGLAKRRILFVDRLVQRTVRNGDLRQVKFLYGWHKRMLRFVSPSL